MPVQINWEALGAVILPNIGGIGGKFCFSYLENSLF